MQCNGGRWQTFAQRQALLRLNGGQSRLRAHTSSLEQGRLQARLALFIECHEHPPPWLSIDLKRDQPCALGETRCLAKVLSQCGVEPALAKHLRIEFQRPSLAIVMPIRIRHQQCQSLTRRCTMRSSARHRGIVSDRPQNRMSSPERSAPTTPVRSCYVNGKPSRQALALAESRYAADPTRLRARQRSKRFSRAARRKDWGCCTVQTISRG